MVDFYQCLIIVSLGKYSKIVCLLYIINIFEREKGNKGNQKSLKITKTYRDICLKKVIPDLFSLECL